MEFRLQAEYDGFVAFRLKTELQMQQKKWRQTWQTLIVHDEIS